MNITSREEKLQQGTLHRALKVLDIQAKVDKKYICSNFEQVTLFNNILEVRVLYRCFVKYIVQVNCLLL
jgi:hypothetical protein